MKLDLHSVIEVSGASAPFQFETDVSEYSFPGVLEFTEPVMCSGEVRNHAGALTVTGELCGAMRVSCARCLKEFSKPLKIPFTAYLARELQDEDSEDTWLLEGDRADIGDIANTALVLNMDARYLCGEDCKGLCPRCGKDLNEGPCGCREAMDPRFAVLGRLLENEE